MVCIGGDVIVCSAIGATFHEYIVRAMELGCDVICSHSPSTARSARKCWMPWNATAKAPHRDLQLYRYSPIRSKVKELIAAGAIGKVKSFISKLAAGYEPLVRIISAAGIRKSGTQEVDGSQVRLIISIS